VSTSKCCLKAALLAAAIVTALVAQDPPPASCTEQTLGTLWPAEAKTDHNMARQLIQTGELYMCQMGPKRTMWKLLSVNIRTLEARSRKKNPDEDVPASALRLRLARR